MTYEYNEVKYGTKGGGNRGIYVRCGTRDQEYKFQPNPHASRQYNKNQSKFYVEAAKAVAGKLTANGLLPRYGAVITVMGEDYTLAPR